MATKKIFSLWTVLLAVVVMLGVTACSVNDNPVAPVTPPDHAERDVAGAWRAEYAKKGTVYQGEDRDDLVYSRAIQYSSQRSTVTPHCSTSPRAL